MQPYEFINGFRPDRMARYIALLRENGLPAEQGDASARGEQDFVTWSSEAAALEYLHSYGDDTKDYEVVEVEEFLRRRQQASAMERWRFSEANPLSVPLTTQGARLWLGFAVFYLAALLKPSFLIGASHTRFWLVDLSTFGVVPLCCLWYFWQSSQFRSAQKRFFSRMNVSELLAWGPIVGALLGIVFVAAAMASSWAIERFGLNYRLFSYTAYLPTETPTKWLAISYFSASAAIVEEFFYRDVLRLAFCATLGESFRIPYVLGSSALFAIVHWPLGLNVAIAAFCFGVVAAVLFLRLQDLRSLLVGHFLVSFCLLAFT